MDRNDLRRILERAGFDRLVRKTWTLWLDPSVRDRPEDTVSRLLDEARELEARGGPRGRRHCTFGPGEGAEWFLKQFHHGGVLSGDEDVYYSTPDRFLAACAGALRARKAGVASPRPLGVITREDASGHAGFYLASHQSLHPLSGVARQQGSRLLTRAGETLARLHEAGLDHGDFQVKNLHLDDEDRLNVVDFDPVRFKVPSAWMREWRLHRFRRSLRKYGFQPEDERAFEHGYEVQSVGARREWMGSLQAPFLALKNTASDCRYWWSGRDFAPIDAEKILIRAPNWVGDAVMSLPLIQTLQESYGEATIDVVCRPPVRAVYRHHADVGEVHVLPSDKSWSFPTNVRNARYSTLVVVPKSFRTGLQAMRSGIPRRVGFATQWRSPFLTDRVPLSGEDRTVHHARLYMELLEPLKITRRDPPSPRLTVPDSLRRGVSELSGGGDYVAFHPGSAYGPAKRWPAQRYRKLADRIIREYDLHVVVLGVSDERALGEDVLEALPDDKSVNLAGETTLEEALAVLDGARVVVANDSGLMHLAGALGTPTLGLFGSSDPDLTHPLGECTDVLYRDVFCSPCFERRCPLEEKRYHCLTRIGVDDVLDRLGPWIEGSTVSSKNKAP